MSDELFQLQFRTMSSPLPPKKYCLCESLRSAFIFVRIFGLLPLTWDHPPGKRMCQFSLSTKWTFYSLTIASVCFYTAGGVVQHLIEKMEENIGRGRSMFILLSHIKEGSFLILSAFLVMLACYNAHRAKTSLNNLSPIINSGLLCDSAAVILRRLQVVFIVFTLLYLLVELAAAVYVNMTDGYEANWNFVNFLRIILNVMPNTFYVLFCSIGALFIAFFGCFEHMLTKTLGFKSLLALHDDRDTHFSLLKYRLCTGKHDLSEVLGKNVPQTEIIEQLRFLHEKICVEIRAMNAAINPQILLLIGTELAVLILTWYSVIIYMNYNNKDVQTNTIDFNNWVFIVVHTWAIVVIIWAGHQIMTLFNGLSDFLFEYSTRYLSLTEHQQIRIFINKLRFSPVTLNASGVFIVGMNLAAPICGNIFTYVLVALQFREHDLK